MLYVSFGSKVRSRTFGCVFGSRLLLYSAGSGVNRVQVVLSGFSVRLFCFVQAKTLCRYGYMSLLGFGMGTMLANFHMCGITFVLRTVFNMLVRNASPR